ncbi:MAG: hypothetical protein AABY83_07730, partial [Pseudomonadota bacterium]
APVDNGMRIVPEARVPKITIKNRGPSTTADKAKNFVPVFAREIPAPTKDDPKLRQWMRKGDIINSNNHVVIVLEPQLGKTPFTKRQFRVVNAWGENFKINDKGKKNDEPTELLRRCRVMDFYEWGVGIGVGAKLGKPYIWRT